MTSGLQKYFSGFCPKNILETLCFLEQEVRKDSFSAWSFANKNYSVSAFWLDEIILDASYSSCHPHPVFDLGSLTKPLFLNLSLILKEKSNFFSYVNKPLKSFLSNNLNLNLFLKEKILNRGDLNLNSFLSHTSGIKNWAWLGSQDPKNLTDIILNKYLSENKEEIYSDLGYFVLARIFEQVIYNNQGQNSWKEILNTTNQYLNTSFSHASITGERHCVPYYPYEHVLLENSQAKNFGFVHDTNGNILSQFGSDSIVSGHAGLFGSVTDIDQVIHYLFSTDHFNLMAEENKMKASRFLYGFDTPSGLNSAAAIHLEEENISNIFGHLGYVGTSFWVNSKTQNFHTLLTQRTGNRKVTPYSLNERVFIIENKKEKICSFFVKNKNDFLKESWENIVRQNLKFFHTHKIVWNQSLIPNYQDMISIRQKIGFNLWDD